MEVSSAASVTVTIQRDPTSPPTKVAHRAAIDYGAQPVSFTPAAISWDATRRTPLRPIAGLAERVQAAAWKLHNGRAGAWSYVTATENEAQTGTAISELVLWAGDASGGLAIEVAGH
jgi:hypothetical protein